MPAYYLERDVGIQHIKDDERLSEEQIRLIATWAEIGALDLVVRGSLSIIVHTVLVIRTRSNHQLN